MHVLFVHGMGRTPVSATPMLWRLRRHGHHVDIVAYLAATEAFDVIVERVKSQIEAVSKRGQYILIGHSLGGILLRAALQQLPSLERKPEQLFLLGSPVRPPRLALKSRGELGFQIFSGDCGQLLASKQRLGDIGFPLQNTKAIIGTRGFVFTKRYFKNEDNDGVVAVSEAIHDELVDIVLVPVVHTFLPSSRRVSSLILADIGSKKS